MITVHGMAASGNCWKVAQILRFTGRSFAWLEVNSTAGATRTPEFLALNPNGKVPVAVLADGTVLTESNAILHHFAEHSPWLPPPGLPRTRMLEWMFFEQYSHEPYIAVARAIRIFLNQADVQAARLADCMVRGGQALDVMERRLSAHPWLTQEGPTIADIALFAYTHVAGDAGFDLARWPGVQAWVARFAALPDVVPIPPAP